MSTSQRAAVIVPHQRVYRNTAARTYKLPSVETTIIEAKAFHTALPPYAPTPLIPVRNLDKDIRLKHVFIKDEGSRLGLPSFKILGASWGAYRAITNHLNLPLDAGLDNLKRATELSKITLFAATDGNHGRAVAHFARSLNIRARIFVPAYVDAEVRDLISSGGPATTVTIIEGDYDCVVQTASLAASSIPDGILIQDTSFPGYETIPRWIVEGYSTMLYELDAQLDELGLDGRQMTLVVPVGVGSLAQAVVSHYKSSGRNASVLTVEPDAAPCLFTSLKAGKITPVETSKTIMDGLNCGTVSSIAWPVLRDGVDVSFVLSELDAHRAVERLASQGIHLGPCGAAGIAALEYIAATDPGCVGLNPQSVIVVLGTEGPRHYDIPIDVPTRN